MWLPRIEWTVGRTFVPVSHKVDAPRHGEPLPKDTVAVTPLGFEPRTLGLKVRCSAVELEGRVRPRDFPAFAERIIRHRRGRTSKQGPTSERFRCGEERLDPVRSPVNDCSGPRSSGRVGAQVGRCSIAPFGVLRQDSVAGPHRCPSRWPWPASPSPGRWGARSTPGPAGAMSRPTTNMMSRSTGLPKGTACDDQRFRPRSSWFD